MRLGRTVAELLDSLDATELQEWQEYFVIDPWTEWRADLRMAHIVAAMWQTHGVKVTPDEFIPQFGPKVEPVERSDDELISLAIKANALMGGKYGKQ